MGTLGPFQLEDELGRGGMARVFRARLLSRDATVALKVLDTDKAGQPEFAALFEREVQAAASLDHPGIVQVLDSGVTEESEADPSRGIEAGAPWLAMEVASGGTLEDKAGGAHFEDIRRWLSEALAGLGHAHARGVLHRDVKPANLLLAAPGDPRPGLKLSDFGIARLLSDGGASSEGRGLVGTPIYMAPELFEGNSNDSGPWTDLYALGCVAHQLVTGSPPFSGSNVLALVQAHVMRAPPALPERADIPPGFQAWVSRLLAKRPEDRFQRAEDALLALQVPDGLDPVRSIPRAWTRPGRESARAQRLRLLGVGLGLVGVRPVPLVGRQAEQSALWTEFAEVAANASTRAAILRSAAGMGRTRLAHWLGEEAWSAGAEVLAVSFVGEESEEPLHRMMAKSLRVRRLSGSDLNETIRQRVAQLGGDDDWTVDSLTALMAGEGEPVDGGVVLGTRAERWRVLRGWIELLATRRPVVLILDDVDTSLEATLLLSWLLEEAVDSLPLLIVATISDARRAQATEAWEKLFLLAQHDRVSVVPLRPLKTAARRQLVEQMLGLEPALARQVEKRSGGSPFFAVQLVGDQVRRGVLVPGPRGFQLVDQSAFTVPENVHTLWRARVSHALRGLPPDCEVALEAISVLGAVVDHADWAAVCAGLGVEPRPELIRALLRHQLVRGRGQTWTLAHSLLGDSLQRSAEEAGRLRTLHAVAAEVLARRIPEGSPSRGARVGTHLLEAGRPAAAFPMLMRTLLRHATTDGSYVQLEALVDLAERALTQLEPLHDDSRWGELLLGRLKAAQGRDDREQVVRLAHSIADRAKRVIDGTHPPRAIVAVGIGEPQRWWALRAGALRNAATAAREDGHLDQAETLFREAEAAFDLLGDDSGLGWSTLGLAFLARYRGNVDEALGLLRQTLEFFQYAEEPVGSARALSALGDLLRRQGDPAQAMGAFRRALKIAESVRNPQSAATCMLNMAHLHLAAGQLDEAEALLLQTQTWYERAAAYSHLAQTLNTLGEIHRARGELDQAEEHYRSSLEMFGRSRSAWAFMPRANLALVQLARGNAEAALATVRTTRDEVAAQGRSTYVLAADVLALACLSELGRWEEMESALGSVEERLAGDKHFDRDVGDALASSARAADAAARPETATRLWSLAEVQFVGLNDVERAADARERASR